MKQEEAGFTLLEVIISLILAGILFAIAGLWIVMGVKAYEFSRSNISLCQKAGLLTSRISRELAGMYSIDNDCSDGKCSTSSCIIYKTEEGPDYFRAIAFKENLIELKLSSASDCDCNTTGNILSDKVESFSLQYEDKNGALTPGPPLNADDLSAVVADFSLNRDDEGGHVDFQIIMGLRNIQTNSAP